MPRRKTRGSTGVAESSRLMARGVRRGPWRSIPRRPCGAPGTSPATGGRAGAPGRRTGPAAGRGERPGRGRPGEAAPETGPVEARVRSVQLRAAARLLPDGLRLVEELTVDPGRIGERSRGMLGQGPGDSGIDRSGALGDSRSRHRGPSPGPRSRPRAGPPGHARGRRRDRAPCGSGPGKSATAATSSG